MRFYLRHPIAVIALFSTLTLAGAIISSYLPVELLPNLKYPRLVVITSLENATAEEIETMITRPVEEAVGAVMGLKSVRSVSGEGISSVFLQFDWGASLGSCAAEVREKLDLVADELPKEAKQPIVLQYDPTDTPVLTLALISRNDSSSLRYFARSQVKTQLETVSGVAAIRLTGGEEYEIQALVDRSRMVAHQIDLKTISERLENANVNFPGGKIHQGEMELPVRTVGRFTSIEQALETPLWKSGSGSAVKVRDVAEVKKGPRDRTSINRFQGTQVVLIGIIKESRANSIEVSNHVHARIAEITRRLPEGINLIVIDDEAPFLTATLGDLKQDILVGGLLAFLTLLFGLRRIQSAALVMISIPVSVLSTFSFMALSGISLNIMSIAGLALGVGMLVDASIVVLEAINRKSVNANTVYEATTLAIKEVSSSVTTGTITTLIALLPIMLIGGLSQRIFKDFAFTLSVSLLVSLLVAIVLLPCLIVWKSKGSSMPGISDRPENRSATGYREFLAMALNRPIQVVSISAGIFALALIAGTQFGFELTPALNTGEFAIKLELPINSGLEDLEQKVDAIETWLKTRQEIASFTTEGGVEQTKAGIEPSQSLGKPNQAKITIKLKRDSPAYSDPTSMITDIRRQASQWPDMKIDFVFRQGPLSRIMGGSDIPEIIRIFGNDLTLLNAISIQAQEILAKSPFFTDVKVEGSTMTQQVQVKVDRNKSAARGISVDDVGKTVRAAIEGKTIGKFVESDQESDIRVRLSQKYRTTIDDLKQLPILSSKDEMSLLGGFAEFIPSEGSREIIRNDRRRSASIHANHVGLSLSAVEKEARAILGSIDMPSGFNLGSGSDRAELLSSLGTGVNAVILSAILVYVTLIVQFESFVWPLVIFTAVPMTIVGPTIAIMCSGWTTNILNLVGMIALIGIVSNNSILMVSFVNSLRSQGMDAFPAIVQGCSIRLKPILMTSATTICGALPLCLDFSGAAPLNRPLAITVVSGLLASSLFTLVLVPTVYLLVSKTRFGKISQVR
jgi:HAE1 family hydrophobic/amphiphilic exporter-1